MSTTQRNRKKRTGGPSIEELPVTKKTKIEECTAEETSTSLNRYGVTVVTSYGRVLEDPIATNIACELVICSTDVKAACELIFNEFNVHDANIEDHNLLSLTLYVHTENCKMLQNKYVRSHEDSMPIKVEFNQNGDPYTDMAVMFKKILQHKS